MQPSLSIATWTLGQHLSHKVLLILIEFLSRSLILSPWISTSSHELRHELVRFNRAFPGGIILMSRGESSPIKNLFMASSTRGYYNIYGVSQWKLSNQDHELEFTCLLWCQKTYGIRLMGGKQPVCVELKILRSTFEWDVLWLRTDTVVC